MKQLVLMLCLLLLGCHSSAEYHDVNQARYQSQDLRGKWLIVNYWASWCSSCIEEIPALNDIAKQRDDVLVFGVNYDANDSSSVKKQIKKLDIHYPVLIENIANNYGVKEISGLPTTLIINPQGRLVTVLHGKQTKHKLLSLVANQ